MLDTPIGITITDIINAFKFRRQRATETYEGETINVDVKAVEINPETCKSYVIFECSDGITRKIQVEPDKDIRQEILLELYPKITMADYRDAIDCLSPADYVQFCNNNKHRWELDKE